MALPTGQISLNQVNVELGLAGTTQISLNQTNVRTLAGVPSGAISMQNLQGKANAADFVSAVFKPTGTLEANGNCQSFGVVSANNNIYAMSRYTFDTPTEDFVTFSSYTATGTLNYSNEVYVTGSRGAFGSIDGLQNLGTDAAGNIYALINFVNGSNCSLIKFNSAGAVQWARNIAWYAVEAFALAVDSSGNSYFSGNSSTTSYVSKVDTNGNFVWIRSIANNVFRSIHTDGTHVYIGGSRYYSPYWNMVFKLDVNGNLVSHRAITGGTFGWVAALTTDSSANVYVAMVRDYGSGYYQAEVHGFDSGLNVLWANGVSFYTASSQMYPTGIAIDSSNNIYVTVKGATPRYILAKINSSGILQWQRTWIRTSSTNSRAANAVAVTASGKIANTGWQNFGSFNDASFLSVVPNDGSKTGAYTLGSQSATYTTGAATTGTPAPATSTLSISLVTPSNPTYNSVSITLLNRSDLVTTVATM